MSWRTRVLTGRLRDQAAVLATVALVALVATTLLGTFALLFEGTSSDALDQALHRAEAEDVELVANVWVNGADGEAPTTAARTVLDRLTGPLETEDETWVTGVLHDLPRPAPGRVAPLAYAAEYPHVEENARLVAGTWPERARDDAGRLLVAVPQVAAERYGWQVGTVVPVKVSREDIHDEWVVTGVHVLEGPIGAWDRDLLNGAGHVAGYPVPGSGGALFTDAWGPMVVAPGTLTGASTVRAVELVSVPQLGDAPAGAVAHLRGGVDDAQIALTAGLDPTDVSGVFRSRVGLTIDAAWRELTVTRVGVVVVGLLLTVLAATVMLLGARLLSERRAAESELLAARGAAPRQLRSLAVREAAGLAALATVVSPWCARALFGVVVTGGPLEAAGFRVPTSPSVVLVATCAVVATVLAVSLVVPQWHAAAATTPGAHAGLVRTGADLALVALAGVALWQLLTYGTPVIGGTGGTQLDPVLVAGPAIVTLGAAVLALRLVRPVGLLADAAARRRRSLVVPLAAWQVARRPAAATGTVLVVVLAVACGTFAQAFGTTWRTSQLDQVDLAMGTDVQLSTAGGDPAAGSRTIDQVLVAHPGVESQPVVDRVVGVGRSIGGALVTSGLRGRLVAVDATRPAFLRGRTDVPWRDVVAPLATAEPAETVPLPGDPEFILLDVTPSLPQAVAGSGHVTLVLEDARGVRTWLQEELSSLEPSTAILHVPPMTLPVSVAAVSTSLSITEMPSLSEDDGAMAYGRAAVTVAPLRVLDRAAVAAGAYPYYSDALPTTAVPLPAATWSGMTSSHSGRSGALIEAAPDGGLTVATQLDVFALAFEPSTLAMTGWESPPSIPAVVSARFARELDLEVGARAIIQVGSADVPIDVLDIVLYIPGAPRGASLMVDREQLSRQLVDARSSDPIVDSWWFAAAGDDDGSAFAADLRATGIGDVTVRAEERVEATTGPLRVAVPVSLSFVGLAAGLLIAVGLGTSATVAVRTRRLELARLQALGASRASLARGLLLENALLVGLGAVGGLAIGYGLSLVVAPVLTVSGDGRRPVPAPLHAWDWAEQSALTGALAGTACLAVLVVAVLLVRRTSGALMRLGDDR